jgi:hypothetical protein
MLNAGKLNVLCAGLVLSAARGTTVEIARHRPCNLFDSGSAVVFDATVRTGKGPASAVNVSAVRDDGRVCWSNTLSQTGGTAAPRAATLELGKLEPGYYELRSEADGQPQRLLSFGVVPFAARTAAHARERHSRFGMKVWTSGDIWWNRRLTWDAGEAMQACAAMGLQWTRAALSDATMGTRELATRHPFNVVSKVECFPESCFDEARFGPLEAYKKTERGKSWTKSTLPKEVPYKAWLKEQLAGAPADQTVFEIWNEPWQWDKTMPAEEFATLCKWAVSVIKEARPDAVVGPNIYGAVNAYDQVVMAAGGLDRMDMVAIHPYASGTPESKGFRPLIRNYHDLLKLKLRRDLELYTTEYGWSTAPQGERVVSEEEQARLTVRESLMLYAEGVKTLIPHTLGQRQQNPKEREDYFGFFRLDNEPKPAVVALATCARMVDGSRFVGDLWLGPGVGAMLFERDDQLTLALWTEKEVRETVIDLGVPSVTAVGLTGRSKTIPATAEGVSVKIGPDVTYLVGVGRQLVQRATPPAMPLNPDRWAARAGSYAMPRMTAAPAVDGHLGDWTGVAASTLHNPKLDDLKAEWRLAWDEKALYVAVDITDRAVVNTNAPGSAAMGDAVVLQIGTRPDRQVSKPDFYDFEVTISPSSVTGEPVFLLKNAAMKMLVNPPQADASGIRWAAVREAKRWTAEAAIPFAALRAEVPKAGQKMAFSLTVFDRDLTDRDEWRQWWKRVETYDKKGRFCEMPYLVFGE